MLSYGQCAWRCQPARLSLIESRLIVTNYDIADWSPSEMLKSSINGDDGSLDNLSQAIANRQQIELQTGAMATRSALRQQQQSERNSTSNQWSRVNWWSSIGDFCTAHSLVDQVIDVDNSVTKLLKVLRLIQMDNDNCIQELVTDK